MGETSPGPSEGSENGKNGPEEPADLKTLLEAISAQNESLVAISNRLKEVEKHQDVADEAIIEVAKKADSSGGKGDLLAQLAPLLQPRSSPLEKIAMRSFVENLAFSTLTTRRIARKQFGDEYTKMVKEMEAEMSGAGGEGGGE